MDDMFFSNKREVELGDDIEMLMEERLDKALRGYSKKSVQNLMEETFQVADDVKRNLERQIKDLFNEKSTLSQECSVLREQLTEIEEKYTKKTDELKDMLESKEEIENNLRNEISEINNENRKLSDELDKIQEEQNKAHLIYEELNNIKEELRIAEENFTHAKEELDRKNHQISELNSELEEKNQELKKLKNEVDSSVKALENDLYDEIESLEKENSRLNWELSDEHERAEKTRKSMQELQEQISNERDKANKSKIRTQEIEREYSILESQLKEYTRELHDLKEEKTNNNKEYEKLEEFNSLYENYNSLREKYDELVSEKEGLAFLVELYQQKEKEYALTYRENTEYLEMISSLEEAIELILGEMEEQRELFNSMANQYDDGKSQIHKLIQEKTQIQIKNVDLLDELSILASKLTKLEEGNVRLTRKMNVSSVEKEDLESDEKLDEDSHSDSKSIYVYDDGNKIAFDAIKRARKMTGDYTEYGG